MNQELLHLQLVLAVVGFKALFSFGSNCEVIPYMCSVKIWDAIIVWREAISEKLFNIVK